MYPISSELRSWYVFSKITSSIIPVQITSLLLPPGYTSQRLTGLRYILLHLSAKLWFGVKAKCLTSREDADTSGGLFDNPSTSVNAVLKISPSRVCSLTSVNIIYRTDLIKRSHAVPR